MNYVINRYDLAMILLFIIILCVFIIYKYMNSTNDNYNNIDKKVDDILNKKDVIKIIKKYELPKNLSIEDYRIPELMIRPDSLSILQEEVKIMV